eukprot:3410034-Karenia_brevis.AAC.1
MEQLQDSDRPPHMLDQLLIKHMARESYYTYLLSIMDKSDQLQQHVNEVQGHSSHIICDHDEELLAVDDLPRRPRPKSRPNRWKRRRHTSDASATSQSGKSERRDHEESVASDNQTNSSESALHIEEEEEEQIDLDA